MARLPVSAVTRRSDGRHDSHACYLVDF